MIALRSIATCAGLLALAATGGIAFGADEHTFFDSVLRGERHDRDFRERSRFGDDYRFDRTDHINREREINEDFNRHFNRDVDGVYDGGCCGGDMPYAAVVGGAMVGSTVDRLGPECFDVEFNGIPLVRCGNAWYRPQYAGTSVQYVVVSPP